MKLKGLVIVALLLLTALAATASADRPDTPTAQSPTCDTDTQVCVLDTTPNDPMFTSQYGPQIIKAPAAWDVTTGTPIIIAILDTGVACNHPDLIGKCVPGWDFVNDHALTGTENSDDYGHGTHVASTAAGATNNGVGIAGVCWQCKIMPVKVCDDFGQCFGFNIDLGLRWAADHGAKVVNMSIGGTDCDCVGGVNYAYGLDVLPIASCGNTGGEPCLQPASLVNSMAVSCTGSNDVLCSFSSRGIEVDVAAPGSSILAAVPTGSCNLCAPSGYRSISGTSMSAPHVTGVAGLIRSLHPEYTNERVYGLIEQAADDKGTPGFDRLYGFGRLDAYDAVTQVAPAGRLSKTGQPPTPTLTPVPGTPTPTASPTKTPVPTKTPTPTPGPVHDVGVTMTIGNEAHPGQTIPITLHIRNYGTFAETVAYDLAAVCLDGQPNRIFECGTLTYNGCAGTVALAVKALVNVACSVTYHTTTHGDRWRHTVTVTIAGDAKPANNKYSVERRVAP